MKFLRLIPVIIGVAILLFGIYLVSTNGYLDGRYLPSLIGIQPCNSGSSSSVPNGTGCTGFTPYGGLGVGTIVCLFGLGLIASSIRRAVASPSASGAAVSPEIVAALAQAQSRIPSAGGVAAPGAKPGTVYCSNCGAANPAQAKFCHQCASKMPAGTLSVSSASPPTSPPGAGT
jgi:zinc-ribbon domain